MYSVIISKNYSYIYIWIYIYIYIFFLNLKLIDDIEILKNLNSLAITN